ncbi:MAG TPA: hypothetical protein V6C81_04405 [Planktothrix sp.]|jgi:hypothetical protein
MLRRLNSAVVLSISLLTGISAVTGSVFAEPLQGNVEQRDEASGKPAAKPLQGGVKNDATLQNSLKIIPGMMDKQKNILPGSAKQTYGRPDGEIEQYEGGVNKSPPLKDPRPAGASATTLTPHVIAPVSTYFVTPKNGIMNWDPDYGAKTFQEKETRILNVAGHASDSVTTHNGVTTYDSEYATGSSKVSTTSTIHVPGSNSSVTTTQSGVSVYEPGFEVGVVPGDRAPSVMGFTSRNTVNSSTPGQDITGGVTREGVTSFVAATDVKPAFSQHGITTYDPAYQVSISTERDGMICWQSNPQSNQMTTALRKETLGGVYYTRDPLPEGLRASPGKLVLNRVPIFVQPVGMPMQTPLVAQGLLLPQLRSLNNDKNLTWKKWYDRLGQAIYARWQYCDVVPGIAHVKIDVDRDRTMKAEVVGFDPGPYAAKVDADTQKAFSQAAIGAINRVTQFEVPQFPEAATDVQRVTIYVDMKRSVDSNAGFTVATSSASPKATTESQK